MTVFVAEFMNHPVTDGPGWGSAGCCCLVAPLYEQPNQGNIIPGAMVEWPRKLIAVPKLVAGGGARDTEE